MFLGLFMYLLHVTFVKTGTCLSLLYSFCAPKCSSTYGGECSLSSVGEEAALPIQVDKREKGLQHDSGPCEKTGRHWVCLGLSQRYLGRATGGIEMLQEGTW